MTFIRKTYKKGIYLNCNNNKIIQIITVSLTFQTNFNKICKIEFQSNNILKIPFDMTRHLF